MLISFPFYFFSIKKPILSTINHNQNPPSFDKCEQKVLPDLSHFANEIADVYRREIQPRVGMEIEGDPRRECEIEILHADAFAKDCDWADSDVVSA